MELFSVIALWREWFTVNEINQSAVDRVGQPVLFAAVGPMIGL